MSVMLRNCLMCLAEGKERNAEGPDGALFLSMSACNRRCEIHTALVARCEIGAPGGVWPETFYLSKEWGKAHLKSKGLKGSRRVVWGEGYKNVRR